MRGGAYVVLEPDARDAIASEAFPGLRLTFGKMLVGDEAGIPAALNQPPARAGDGS